MGVTIEAAEVESTLEAAYALASREGDALIQDERLRSWCNRVRNLQQPIVPKTYLAVVTTMLTAKAMHGDRVDVTLLQTRAGPRGYSASSVDSVLAGFAKSHRIDLRSTSQAPFNNQPFTFKETLGDVQPGKRQVIPFMVLRDTADVINEMSSGEALWALGATFVLTRRVETPPRVVDVTGGRDAYQAVCSDLAEFVAEYSDGGRVGQALCAALLDLIHTDVMLGVVNDPDARLAGDVHAMDDGIPWLWCEVKQKVVVTGDVASFMRKVAAAGGQRCLYLALANRHDARRIMPSDVDAHAYGIGVDVTLVQTPEEAIALLTQFAAGEQGRLAARLLERMRIRVVESNGSPDVLEALDRLIERHGDLN